MGNPVKVIKNLASGVGNVADEALHKVGDVADAVVKPVVNVAEKVAAPVLNVADKGLNLIGNVADKGISLVGDVANKGISLVGDVAESVVVNPIKKVVDTVTVNKPDAAAPTVAPTPTDTTASATTIPQTALMGRSGDAPGKSGGEVEVRKGKGRLLKNVQRSRAQFNTAAGSGSSNSSIRI